VSAYTAAIAWLVSSLCITINDSYLVIVRRRTYYII